MATVIYGAFFITITNAVVDIALRAAGPADQAELTECWPERLHFAKIDPSKRRGFQPREVQ